MGYPALSFTTGMMPPLFLIIIILAPEFFQFPAGSHPRAWTTAPAAATAATATTAPRLAQQLDLGTAIIPAHTGPDPRATTARLAQRSGYGIPCLDLAQVNLRKSQALLYLQLHAHPNTRSRTRSNSCIPRNWTGTLDAVHVHTGHGPTAATIQATETKQT